MSDELKEAEEIKLRVHGEEPDAARDDVLSQSPGNAASSEHPTARQLLPGEMISERYKVLSVIGAGAMGAVYLVEQVYLGQNFALKTIHPASANATSAIKMRRFHKEAQAAGKLDHPNLVRTIDFGMIDEVQPFLVMDFVEGKTFDRYLAETGPLPVEKALDIFIPIFEAIEYAHKQGVVHRDIKPGNIVLTQGADTGVASENQTVAKLFDFGIAKIATEDLDQQTLTKTGEIFGTPLYMSPEQCGGGGKVVDGRSDIYSLGCVFFEALTGTPPFIGSSYIDTLMLHMNQTAASLKEASMGREFSSDLERVVHKMLEKDPAQRYQSAEDTAADLRRLRKGEKVTASASDRVKTQKGNNTKFVLLTALLTLVIAGTVFGVLAPQVQTMIAQFDSSNPFQSSSDPYAASQPPRKTLEEKLKESEDPHFTAMSAKRRSNFGLDQFVEQPFYEHKQGKAPNIQRVYEFGEQNLGVFGGAKAYDPIRPYPHLAEAIGGLQLPDSYSRSFQTDDRILRQSTLLSRFEPDDLDVLGVHLSQDMADPTLGAVYDAVLAPGSKLTSLRKLELKGPFSINALTNMKIDNLKNLDALSLDKTNIDCSKLANMRFLKRLQFLELAHTKNVTPVLKALRNSPNLKYLKLRQSDLTNQDLGHIKAMKNLRKLDANLHQNQSLSHEAIRELSSNRDPEVFFDFEH